MWEEGTADQARKVDGTKLGRQQLTPPKASSSLEWTAAANSYCFNVALLATLDLRRSQSCRWALSLQNLARRCGFGCSCGPGRIHPVQRHLNDLTRLLFTCAATSDIFLALHKTFTSLSLSSCWCPKIPKFCRDYFCLFVLAWLASRNIHVCLVHFAVVYIVYLHRKLYLFRSSLAQ